VAGVGTSVARSLVLIPAEWGTLCTTSVPLCVPPPQPLGTTKKSGQRGGGAAEIRSWNSVFGCLFGPTPLSLTRVVNSLTLERMDGDFLLVRAPIRTDADGVIRVDGTRVTLDTVVATFDAGATPEEIVQQYPSVALPHI
jgi:hypothetical protein